MVPLHLPPHCAGTHLWAVDFQGRALEEMEGLRACHRGIACVPQGNCMHAAGELQAAGRLHACRKGIACMLQGGLHACCRGIACVLRGDCMQTGMNDCTDRSSSRSITLNLPIMGMQAQVLGVAA
jgi:hypothetical protein